VIKIKKALPKFLIIALFLIFSYLAYLVLNPFFLAILSAGVIAYVFYPLYNKLLKLTKIRGLASILTLIIILILMMLPLTFIISTLSKEAVAGYGLVTKFFEENQQGCNNENLLCSLVLKAQELSKNSQFKTHFNQTFKTLVNFIVGASSSFLLSIPQKVFQVFITFFLMFFFFTDGKKMIRKMWDLISISEQNKNQIIKKISDVSYAVIYGSIVVAIIQGGIATIGYWAFGLKTPIFWGVMTAIVALIPLIGTGIVWVPASLVIIVNSIMMSDTTGIIKGIGLFIYGALIISTVDNFIRPKIIGDRARIHPALVLLGVIGGLIVFGLVGGIVGPLVLALFFTFIEMYRQYVLGRKISQKQAR